MAKGQPDYSLYYVTDRAMTPVKPGQDPIQAFLEHLEQACQGGVTMIQLREKTATTREFLDIAKASKQIADKYNIPILVNDRLDIALATGCGLHVGQDDFPAALARQLLGKDVLLGLSVNTAEELKCAVAQNIVDYIGIGPTHATQTKKDHSPALGPRGTRDLLGLLEDSPIKTVAIGGLNDKTIPNLLVQSPAFVKETGKYRSLDGVAFVSVVAASSQPREAAENLARIYKQSLIDYSALSSSPKSEDDMVRSAVALLQKLRETDPLVIQNITNNVVMNDTANLCLAFTSSPIMSGDPEEAEELGKIVGSLVLNMGTLHDRQVRGATIAGQTANRNRKPIVLDPVGVGATAFRKRTVNQLMNDVHMTVIKGNAGEIGALAGLTEVQSRGVDSAGPGFKDPATVVMQLAQREKCVVVMSGKTDYISDGTTAYAIENGHMLQGDITGSGCMCTSAIACFASVAGVESALEAAVAGVLSYNIAAEIAGSRPEVNGPNTFRSALIDACFNIKPDDVQTLARLRRL